MRLQGILTFSFVISNSIQVYSEKTHVHYLIIHETPVFDIIHKSEPNMSEKKKTSHLISPQRHATQQYEQAWHPKRVSSTHPKMEIHSMNVSPHAKQKYTPEN